MLIAVMERRDPLPLWSFALLVAPFAANDVGLILAHNAATWLAVDYGSKAAVVIAIFATPALRRALVVRCTRPSSWLRAGLLTVAITAASIALLEGLDRTGLDAATALQSFFPIEDATLLVIDLTLGLLLTALAEEAVFRGAFLDAFAARLSRGGIYLLSGILFAAIHWSNGVGTIAGAFVVGLLLMALTRASGSLLPAIAAHFAINLVLFWP